MPVVVEENLFFPPEEEEKCHGYLEGSEWFVSRDTINEWRKRNGLYIFTRS